MVNEMKRIILLGMLLILFCGVGCNQTKRNENLLSDATFLAAGYLQNVDIGGHSGVHLTYTLTLSSVDGDRVVVIQSPTIVDRYGKKIGNNIVLLLDRYYQVYYNANIRDYLLLEVVD